MDESQLIVGGVAYGKGREEGMERGRKGSKEEGKRKRRLPGALFSFLQKEHLEQ